MVCQRYGRCDHRPGGSPASERFRSPRSTDSGLCLIHGVVGIFQGRLLPRLLTHLDVVPLCDFELCAEGPGWLFVVVDHDAMGQVEEVAGVAVDHAIHLGRPQCRLGGDALPLPSVLPPGSEGRQGDVVVILATIGSQPGCDDGLDEGVGEAAPGQGLVGVEPSGATSLLVGLAGGGPGVLDVGVKERVQVGRAAGAIDDARGVAPTEMRPGSKGAFEDGGTVLEFTSAA